MRFFTFPLLAALTAAAASLTFVYLWQTKQLAGSYLKQSTAASQLVSIIKQEISAPPPLYGPRSQAAQSLTIKGILQQTNLRRKENGLPPVSGNEQLNQAAALKLHDMFANQYFEHVSPNGTGPADLVNQIGYSYIRVGENLALGNYQGDADVVQAWMDSPGHRANILSPGFTELGIAVGSGIFEGQQTWLAIQTFALPESACPTPDPSLQNTFDDKNTAAAALSAQLEKDQAALSNNSRKSSQLLAEAKELAKQGNAAIKEGNQLISKGNDLAQSNNPEPAQAYWDQGQALQQKGQSLIEQAQAKQSSAKKPRNELQLIQTNYNSQVDRANSLNTELDSLAHQLNKQINTYNSCVQQYTK